MSSIDAASLTRQLNAEAVATRSNRAARRPGVLRAWFVRWRVWCRIRRDEAWLRNQPDYLLHDIGLARREIAPVVRNGRYL